VTPRLCPRCHAIIHREDEGTLVYCWNCGAPQVLLSEELLEQIDKQIADEHSGTATIDPPPELNSAGKFVMWRGAIQCAGLAGAVAAAFVLLAFVLPPVSMLWLFWLMGAPIVVMGIYSARFRQTLITTGFGARLGLLCGLAIALATVLLDTIGLLLQRFVFHSSGTFDAALANSYSQMRAAVVAQPSAALALGWLAIPEFRAGFVLSSAVLLLVLYLGFSATTGAFAGYLRSRATR
jgi:hypothetical protein